MTYLQDQQSDLEVLQDLILGVIVQEIFNNKLVLMLQRLTWEKMDPQ